MANLFHVIFYQPIFNGLMVLQRYLPGHDIGIAIIGVTLAIRALLIWPYLSQIRSSRSMQVLQPKMKALQEKYKNDKQEYGKQVMALYREHKVNPLSSCLPLLIQLPFLFAMYRVFISGIQIDAATGLLHTDRIADLYAPLRAYFTATPVSTTSLGFLNLSATRNIFLAVIVGISQYIQTKMLTPKTTPNVPGAKDESATTAMTKQMNYILPLFTAWIAYVVPAGLSLYFLATNLFSIVQQFFMFRKKEQAPVVSLKAKP